MRTLSMLIIGIVLGIAVILAGCSSSQEGEKDRAEKVQPPPSPKPEEQPAVKIEQPKGDTVTVDRQSTEKPAYEPTRNSAPTGKYTVQIGAYKMPDNADRIAALAKERFTRPIYTFQDKKDNLYKVMIGDFMTKDDARNFRDQMEQQFPTDYKDAWVSEVQQ